MPTAVYEMHGVKIPQNELPDRGIELGQHSGYVPMSDLTSGEFRLHLLYKELDAIERMYPEFREVARRGKALIDNSLAQGLHNGGHKSASVGALYHPMLQTVAKRIHEFRHRSTPTMRTFARRKGVRHIGDPVIPQRSGCTAPPFSQAPGDFETPGQWTNYWNAANQVTIRQCQFEAMANNHLEGASPHFLYEFLEEVVHPNNAPSLVAIKYHYQTITVTDINKIGRLWQRSDLREWIRLGVKLSNAKGGLGLLPPKESILGLINNKDEPGIGAFALIPFLAILIKAIVAITGMIVAIKASSRGNDDAATRIYELQTKGLIGSNNASANTGDWGGNSGGGNPGGGNPGGGGGNNDDSTGSNNTLLIIGAATAGLLLLNSK